jgi:DNA replication initiation complex subunit (GINS family)
MPQPLPADFYQQAMMYLSGVNEELTTADTHTIQGRLLVTEKEMTERLLNELRQTRIQKIVSVAQNRISIQTTSLIEEELNVFEKIKQSLSSLRQQPPHRQDGQTGELSVVRFLEDIPEIVGVDLRIYGPFKKEDVASLPAPNAHALEKQGAAKAVEVRSIT